jgi:hypothetical protein
MRPTRKGVSLPLKRWQQLVFATDMLQRLRETRNSEGSAHLGGNIYASKNSGWLTVDLRLWWKPETESELKPTRIGICLRASEWSKIMENMGRIQSFIPEMVDVIPCMQSEDHQNQLGFLRCPECNPNNTIY